MSFPNGTLLQVDNKPEQYVVLDSQTCWIPNLPTRDNLFTPAAVGKLKKVSQAEFDAIPAGPQLTPGASLATAKKAAGEPQWLLSWGQRCWIVSSQVFEAYGFDDSKLKTDPDVMRIPQGPDVV